jgi:DNA-binding response OmpR family regulator
MAPLPKKVLVIDDDKAFCNLVASAFKTQGFEVSTALDGETGLKLFKGNPVPVVITDVAMPGLSGFQVAEAIRKQETPDQHTIIVIMTAYARSFDVSKQFDADIDSYLSKPILPEDIVAHILTLIA